MVLNFLYQQKAGYKFDGWYTEENNGSQVNGITKDNLSDIFRNEATVTLYAHWTLLNYTITYEGLNDATNTNPSNYTVETEAITLAAPVQERDIHLAVGTLMLNTKTR